MPGNCRGIRFPLRCMNPGKDSRRLSPRILSGSRIQVATASLQTLALWLTFLLDAPPQKYNRTAEQRAIVIGRGASHF